MAKIVTVYTHLRQPFQPSDMSHIRWLKMSQALARLGHEVDIATNEFGLLNRRRVIEMESNLRRVPLSRLRWEQYDLVKTLFHRVGSGNTGGLDRRFVSHIGPVPYGDSWDYLFHAHVGIVLALGPHRNDNESTKIYHYLRAGLPVVCESGFSNEHLVTEATLGHVAPNGDLGRMAELIVATADPSWDRAAAAEFVLRTHTWDHRAGTYDALLRSNGMT
jgi:hypothetical protein